MTEKVGIERLDVNRVGVNACAWDFQRRGVVKDDPHTTGPLDPLGEAQLTALLAELGLSNLPPEEQHYKLGTFLARLHDQFRS